MDNQINNVLVLYAVRNNKGQYFRAKGYGGGGNTWVDDINKAKIYGKTGGARGTITWFANNYPNYPTPDLIKLTVTGIEVMDEKGRVEKAKQKIGLYLLVILLEIPDLVETIIYPDLS